MTGNCKNTTFGFDIGITSIGAAVTNDNKLEYLGVRMFNQAQEAKEARTARGARRNLARKKWRKAQLKEAFQDFGVIERTELEKEGFNSFTFRSEVIEPPKDRTVYHPVVRSNLRYQSEKNIHFLKQFQDLNTTFLIKFASDNLLESL